MLCETVHRTKGLERTAVILVDMSGEPDKVLLYVGVSRAVSVLRLVGPQALAHAVGVPAAPSAPGPEVTLCWRPSSPSERGQRLGRSRSQAGLVRAFVCV